ncbi:MAG: hypothetical protein KA175_05990 [Flavobacteriales bacterium]|nr:hypothetical protein [Flavobacteriales bacterium]
MAFKKFAVNSVLVLLSTGLSLVAAEWIFRYMVFSSAPAFKGLKDAGYYADPFNEAAYWKLYYLFGGEYGPPADPHPLLGWRGDFKPGSLMHRQAAEVGARRPVLLYGDSYAQCMPEVTCFQQLLNTDTAFARDHFLLNYGTGGYGVDQIALLFEQTFLRYERPVVVFSLMVTDMDRSPLDWRTGQKPYFSIEGDGLRLNGVPIDPDPANYVKEHGVGITSYLWRRFLYSKVNFLPDAMKDRLMGWSVSTEHKKRLNTRILERVVERLRAGRVDFVFLVFHYLTPDQPEFMVGNENNWRDAMLRDFLKVRDIPYIWSKDLILADPAWTGANLDKYMLLDNGHPTTYFNGLIAQEVERKVLAMDRDPAWVRPVFAPPSYAERARQVENAIRADSAWYASVQRNAQRYGQTIEARMAEEAWYTVAEEDDVVKAAVRAAAGN